MLIPNIPAAVKLDLQRVHDQMARQYVAKSYDAMVDLTRARFAPEFRYRKLVGWNMDLLSISAMRDDELGRAAKGQGDGPIRWRTRLDGWSRRGDTLTVVAHHNVDGEWLKPDGRHPVRFVSEVRETWVRREGEWKAQGWQETGFRGLMDGKVFEKGRRPKA